RAEDADIRSRSGRVLARRQTPGRRLRPRPRRSARPRCGNAGASRQADRLRLGTQRYGLLTRLQTTHHRPQRWHGPGLGHGPRAGAEEGGAMTMLRLLMTLIVGAFPGDDSTELLPPVPVLVGGKPLDVARDGHSAPFVGDFDGDGQRDLLV